MPGGGKRIEPVFGFDESTGLDGVGLVVEDQYLQVRVFLSLLCIKTRILIGLARV